MNTPAPYPAERRIRVDAKKFAAACNFISREKTRYYLNGVHIEPHVNGGVLMVATDGHTLAAVYDPTGIADGPHICPVSPRLRQAARSRKPHFAHAVAAEGKQPEHSQKQIHFVGHVAYLTGGTASVHWESNPVEKISSAHIHTEFSPAIDGTFPEWRRVVPDLINRVWQPDGSRPFAINGEKIAQFTDAIHLISGSRGRALTFHAAGRSEPIGIVSHDVPEFFGIIMPMRGRDCPANPVWLENKAPTE